MLALGAGSPAAAQPAAVRRVATLAALAAYPAFYHAQPILVRGTLATEARGPVVTSPDAARPIHVVFRGNTPPDGPVELRAEFWDIGRLPEDDPRVDVRRLRAVTGGDADSAWPLAGEVLVLVVSEAAPAVPFGPAPLLREVALDPAQYVGTRITVRGQFRGRNLYGDLPQTPGISSWDFVLRSADAALWVAGQRPRGKGFDLDVGARVDTGRWLEVVGMVRTGRGLVWLEQAQIVLSEPPAVTGPEEAPAAPVVGPAPEVIFSDPSEGETDVPRTTRVRIQFSRDLSPDSFKGQFQVVRAADVIPGSGQPEPPVIKTIFRYDPATRSLELRFAEPLEPFQAVRIALGDGVTALDGAQLRPWTLTFTAGGR